MADNKARAAAPKANQPSWLPTDRASSSKLNTVADSVDALLSPDGAPEQGHAEPFRRIETFMMQIEKVFSDCIVCKQILSSGKADDDGRVIVAKPPLMRRSLYDDKTRNGITFRWNDEILDGGERTATAADDTSEIQVIVPSYQVGDMLVVTNGPDPWLTTIVGSGVENDEIKGLILTAYDTNVDGRAWARKLDQTLGNDA